MDDREKEILKKSEVDQNWTNWLLGFLVYAGVIVRQHPD